MKRPELKKLDRIVGSLERLCEETDDMVVQSQLRNVIRTLLETYSSAKRDCEATERA